MIEETPKEKFDRMARSRLAKECSKLDPAFEKAMSEEGYGFDNLISKARKQARIAGMKRSDIAAAVRRVRLRNKIR